MHIVYTVNGEGMGHASRSSVVIDYLRARGHTVTIFSSGQRPLSFLRARYGDVHEVTGIHMVYRDNAVQRLRTVAKALKDIRLATRDLSVIRRALKNTKPDCVITDFDIRGPLIAQLYGLPLVSVDNIQYLAKTKVAVMPVDATDYRLNYLVATLMVPRADHFFITAFDQPRLRASAKKATIIPPILRPMVIDAMPTEHGDYYLVYQTADSNRRLFSILEQTRERYIVYNAQCADVPKNVSCRTFSEEQFIRDLAGAKAVIANGGFTVLSEAIALHKPVLSVPLGHFYEQILNAQTVETMGYGRAVRELSVKSIHEFSDALPLYQKNLSGVLFDVRAALSAIEAKVAELAEQKIRRRAKRVNG